MAFDIKDYDLLDPDVDNPFSSYDAYCGECVEKRCWMYPFASYDADGDLMEFVVTPASLGYFSNNIAISGTPEVLWYKKSGTDDTPAKKPYRYMQAPCCYTLTLEGTKNSDIDVSWCRNCNELNGSYNSHGYNFSAYTSSYNDVIKTLRGIENYSTTLGWKIIFPLCSFNDYTSRLYPDGIDDAKYFSPTCSVDFVSFETYLDDSNPPNIIAKAKMWMHDNQWVSMYPSLSLSVRKVVGWEKTLGTYDGNYYNAYSPGDLTSLGVSFPSGTLDISSDKSIGDFGTYDGRNFSVQFTSADLSYDTSDYPYRLPASGLCDFSSATLTISPNNSVNKNLLSPCFDSNYFFETDEEKYCKSITLNNVVDFNTISGTPRKINVSVNNITSLDDNIPNSGLALYHCQKCTNLNTSYDLKYILPITITSATNKWVFSYENLGIKYKATNTNEFLVDRNFPDTCCDCGLTPPISSSGTVEEPYSTCVNNMLAYFDYVEGGSYYDFRFNVDFVTSTKLEDYEPVVVAKFIKHIQDVPKVNGVASIDLNSIVDCQGLSYDLTFDSQIAIEPSGWQRCDFSNASVNVMFPSFNNNITPLFNKGNYYSLLDWKAERSCVERKYYSKCLVDRYDKTHTGIIVSIPDGGFVCNDCGCETSEFVSGGDYYLENTGLVFDSTNSFTYTKIGDNSRGSKVIYCNNASYYVYCNPTVAMNLSISCDPWGWISVGGVSVSFGMSSPSYLSLGGSSPGTMFGCDWVCRFSWRKTLTSYKGSGIKNSLSEEYGVTTPYISWEDLNGLELEFGGNWNCGRHWYGTYPIWEWTGGNVTLSLV